jgi:hypothetical protein
LEFPAAQTDPVLDPSTLEALAEIARDFGLTRAQELGLRAYAVREGLQYLQDKARIVRSQPRANVARAFLAALRDDWQPPKAIERLSKPKRSKKQDRDAEDPAGWREWVQREYPKAEIPASFRELQMMVPSVARECKESLSLLSADNKASPLISNDED